MNIALNYITDKRSKFVVSDEETKNIILKSVPPVAVINASEDLEELKQWKKIIVDGIYKCTNGTENVSKTNAAIGTGLGVAKMAAAVPAVTGASTILAAASPWLIPATVGVGIGAGGYNAYRNRELYYDKDKGWLDNLGKAILNGASSLFFKHFYPNETDVGRMFGGVVSDVVTEIGERLCACNKRIKELEKENEMSEWQNKKAYEKAVKEGSAYSMSAEEFKEFNKDRGKWYVDKLLGYIDKYKKSGGSKEVNDMLVTDFNRIFVNVPDAKAIKTLVRRYVAKHREEVLKRIENG